LPWGVTPQALPELAADLVRRRVAVIVTPEITSGDANSSPSSAARRRRPGHSPHARSNRQQCRLSGSFIARLFAGFVREFHRGLSEGLSIRHLRLAMGQSMGGMHTWLWGVKYPDAMDALSADGITGLRRVVAILVVGIAADRFDQKASQHPVTSW
jgi:pimeloyl-ACP methyl ester carboxylesterase